MTTFIPDLKAPQGKTTPFFEDSPDLGIPGRATTKSIEKLQQEIIKLMGELGAFNTYFVPGQFPTVPIRYGFQIHFNFAASQGRVDIAALPVKHPTPAKRTDSQKQALYLFRDKIQALVAANYYEPGGMPLVPYLIGNTGQTVTEALVAAGGLPALKSGAA